jgi:hypothetical protein
MTTEVMPSTPTPIAKLRRIVQLVAFLGTAWRGSKVHVAVSI